MTRNFLTNLLESAFDYAAMEDALVEVIADLIDYENLAEQLIERHSEDINERLLELAEEMA